MKLKTDRDGDKDDKSAIEMREDRPEEGMLEMDACAPDKDGKDGRIEGRHLHHEGEDFLDRRPAASDERCAECIDDNIHDNHDDNHRPHGFSKMRRAASFRSKGRMREDHDSQSCSDMAGIREGGNGFKSALFRPSQMKHMRHSHREEIHDRQKDERRRNHQKIIRFEVVPVHRVKNETGQHDPDRQAAVRRYVDLELAVQKHPCPDEGKERQDIIPQNLK